VWTEVDHALGARLDYCGEHLPRVAIAALTGDLAAANAMVSKLDTLPEVIERMIDYGAEGGTWNAGRNKGLEEARGLLVAALPPAQEAPGDG
jgi:hypothetical protein